MPSASATKTQRACAVRKLNQTHTVPAIEIPFSRFALCGQAHTWTSVKHESYTYMTVTAYTTVTPYMTVT